MIQRLKRWYRSRYYERRASELDHTGEEMSETIADGVQEVAR